MVTPRYKEKKQLEAPTKKCPHCEKYKPVGCFSRYAIGKKVGKYRSLCDRCRDGARVRSISNKNKISFSNTVEDRYRRILSALKGRMNQRMRNLGIKEPFLQRYDRALRIMYSMVIPERCPYLDIPLVYFPKFGTASREASTFSIDRIDSSKGYEVGNVQIISDMANQMKNQATEEQMITFARNVLKLHAKE